MNWTSDDATIATVDSHGTITGVAEGKTVVRAVSQEGSFADYVVVVVSPKPPIHYPHEVLEADELYKMEDYTVPSFIPFWVAKEAARVDRLRLTRLLLLPVRSMR